MLTLLLFAISGSGSLSISSSAFKNNEKIPVVYTCEGKSINPPLAIDNIPARTKSLVIIVDDPDTDHGTFDHWVVYNISPVKMIKENSNPGTEGLNGTGKTGYMGPCPPKETHRYFFKIYALDTMLDIKGNPDKKAVQQAMANHIIAQGELIGLYQKKGK